MESRSNYRGGNACACDDRPSECDGRIDHDDLRLSAINSLDEGKESIHSSRFLLNAIEERLNSSLEHELIGFVQVDKAVWTASDKQVYSISFENLINQRMSRRSQPRQFLQGAAYLREA